MSNCTDDVLTTADFAVVEAMLHCENGPTGPRALGFRRKLRHAVVVLPCAVPTNVATLGSRIRFRVAGGLSEERTLVGNAAHEVIGMTLPAWTTRGLTLLGMKAGEEKSCLRLDGTTETIRLEQVYYQPESNDRELSLRSAIQRLPERADANPNVVPPTSIYRRPVGTPGSGLQTADWGPDSA